MRAFAISVAALAAATVFAPLPSSAQVSVDVPGVGVHIGDRPHYRHYRDYDGPAFRERRIYRERAVGLRGDCRTITIHRDDGSMKRIRRCD